MDDITPDMDWARFDRFIGLLDRYDVKPLLGIVPDNRDVMLQKDGARADFWELAQKWQGEGYSLAMHGYRHVYVTKSGGLFPLNRFSEFAGLPKDAQLQKLSEGKEILLSHGIRTDIFMAPAHSYDQATLQCLRQLGFRYITDGFGHRPYERDGLVFLPISAWKRGELSRFGKKERRGGLEAHTKQTGNISSAKEGEAARGCVTFVYHVNTMSEQDFSEFEAFLMRYREHLASYSSWFVLAPKKRSMPAMLTERALATAKRLL